LTLLLDQFVGILDVKVHGERRLAETVDACGARYKEASSHEELGGLLRDREVVVGLVAFEALWPSPQQRLRALRSQIGRTRLIVAYSEGTPRLRFGQRLWAAGLFDSFVPRSAPAHELVPILRQTFTEILLEEAGEAAAEAVEVESAPYLAKLRLLHDLGAAFVSHSSVDGILRELQNRLLHLDDLRMLQVLLLDATSGEKKLFIYQTSPWAHTVLTGLAEKVCASVSPFAAALPTLEELVLVENPPLLSEEEAGVVSIPFEEMGVLAIPLIHCGQLVGGLGALVEKPAALTAELRLTLRLVSFHLATALHSAQVAEMATREALVDELTGAHNRKAMGRILEAEWKRAKRYCLNLSVAMIDIDHFKGLNDSYGHTVGDAVVRSMAGLLRQHLRETDHLIRYGGEEFLVVLPETTPSETALVLERLRYLLRRQPIHVSEDLGSLHVTFSAGITATPGCSAATVEDLVDTADKALVIAKQSGRDRSCVAHGQAQASASGTIDTLAPPDNSRRFPRIPAQLKMRFLPLPELEGKVIDLTTVDLSSGGVGIRGPASKLKTNSYALVFLENDLCPILSRVVWTTDEEDGTRSAGLSFVKGAEFEVLSSGSLTQPTQRPRALLVAEQDSTRTMALKVLHAARYDTDLLTDVEAISQVPLKNYAVILVGESSLRKDLGPRLKELRTQSSETRIVVINEIEDREKALRTVYASRADSLVAQRNAEEALFATLSKLTVGQFFGIKKYLLWGTEPNAWSVLEADDKVTALEGIREVATKVGCHARIIDNLVAAVEEMIINALYHPTSTTGKRWHPVTVEAGSDGRFLAVAVIDEHGLFVEEDLFRSIGQALEVQDSGLAQGAEHAHLGFRIMLNTLSQLVINVDPGKRTEIIGIIDLRRTLKEQRLQPPSVGLFRKKDSDPPPT
jgi:diguanylate cyclase (GGDEF)-like protein